MLRLVADESRMRPLSLSLREVAREAGISAPAIYRHFEGKDDLARAAMDALFEQLLGEMDDAEKSSDGQSAEQRLAALGHAYGRFAEKHPSWFRFLFSDRSSHRERTAEVADRWLVAVNRLSDSGTRFSPTPEVAAMSVWSSVHGRLVLEGTASGVWKLGDVHDFIDVLTRSLASPEAPGNRNRLPGDTRKG